ncbi:FAD:protein FMN transferase [Gramella sp. AN32]|uniref:FAD:protein FMN transferase n=1 Tax=Christiangramia antarctica TaxID=2058158 RepID=A0ABW5X5T4_9FLAO|nr:FAD:protein FMN transferase [Gramella sp. AN32]MCM4154795.1 FAD:protein FMN transferase [Gramella sp. AN32]
MKYYIFFFSALFLFSCNPKNGLGQVYTGEALGTTYNIQFFSEGPLENFESSLDSIFSVINHSLSTYTTKSDISKINRGDTLVVVDDHFRKVFEASKDVYNKSQGYFDPTVGILVNAYGFGPGKPIKQLDRPVLDSLQQLVGFNNIELSTDNTIQKKDAMIYLDFNAIAKGYTIDVIADFLESNDVDNYLVELGGELRAKGKNLDKDANWVVGIDDPMQQEGDRVLKATLELNNSAMATSGNYRKFREDSLTGQKFVHTINPLTGKAEKSNLLSASVLAETCMMADGYATAFMAMGFESSRDLAEKLDIQVYLVYSSENGQVKIYNSPGFKYQ